MSPGTCTVPLAISVRFLAKCAAWAFSDTQAVKPVKRDSGGIFLSLYRRQLSRGTRPHDVKGDFVHVAGLFPLAWHTEV